MTPVLTPPYRMASFAMVMATAILSLTAFATHALADGAWVGLGLADYEDPDGKKFVKVIAVHPLGPSAGMLFPGTIIEHEASKSELIARLKKLPDDKRAVYFSGRYPSGDKFSATINAQPIPKSFHAPANCPSSVENPPKEIWFYALESRDGIDALEAEEQYVQAITGCSFTKDVKAMLRSIARAAQAKNVSFESLLSQSINPKQSAAASESSVEGGDPNTPRLKSAPDHDYQYTRAIQSIAFHQSILISKIRSGKLSTVELEQLTKDTIALCAHFNSVNPLDVDALSKLHEIELRFTPVINRLRKAGIGREQLVEDYKRHMIQIFHPAKDWSPTLFVSAYGFEVDAESNGFVSAMEKFSAYKLMAPSHAYLIKHDKEYRKQSLRR